MMVEPLKDLPSKSINWSLEVTKVVIIFLDWIFSLSIHERQDLRLVSSNHDIALLIV